MTREDNFQKSQIPSFRRKPGSGSSGFIRIILLLILAQLAPGCGIIPHRYQAAPITGQVIDKDTRQPLEGVHVAVYWQLYDETAGPLALGGRVSTDVMGISETVTDKDGYYHIPGWGPEYEVGDYLGGESPYIGFYKKGYKFRREYNSSLKLLVTRDFISEDYEHNIKKTRQGDMYTSIWDGVVIELEREKNDIQQKIYNLEAVDRFIDSILRGKDCESKSIKRFIVHYSLYAESINKVIKKNIQLKLAGHDLILFNIFMIGIAEE